MLERTQALKDAIEMGVITVDKQSNLYYSGKCNECLHSKCNSYPASSNMCMNEKSEWYGCFHVDYQLNRYVNGCGSIEKRGDENG